MVLLKTLLAHTWKAWDADLAQTRLLPDFPAATTHSKWISRANTGEMSQYSNWTFNSADSKKAQRR